MERETLLEARPEFLEGSNQTGILVIHGFTGSTQSMRPLAYALNKKGYTVSLPCLKGHGTSAEDLESCQYTDWTDSVSTAFNELRLKVKNVFVAGLSMGGTLSLFCAINFKVSGIVTINAAIDLPAFDALSNNPDLPRFIQGIGSDIKKSDAKELAYDRTPTKSIKEIIKLTKKVKNDLSQVVCPTLIFSSTEDHVVPTTNQKYIFDHIGSSNKKLIELKDSYHVATLDNDFDQIVDQTLVFIKENT